MDRQMWRWWIFFNMEIVLNFSGRIHLLVKLFSNRTKFKKFDERLFSMKNFRRFSSRSDWNIDIRYASIVSKSRQSFWIDVLLWIKHSSWICSTLGRKHRYNELNRTWREFGDEISTIVERMDVTRTKTNTSNKYLVTNRSSEPFISDDDWFCLAIGFWTNVNRIDTCPNYCRLSRHFD